MELIKAIQADGIAFLLSSFGILSIVALAEFLAQKGRVSPENTRRWVHLSVGLFVVISPYYFESATLIIALAVSFGLFNVAAIHFKWLKGIHGVLRKSSGTATFPLALIVGTLITWHITPDRIYMLQMAFLILAVADPIASIAGEKWKSTSSTDKSGVGSAAFFITTCALAGFGWMVFYPETHSYLDPSTLSLSIIGVALMATWSEFIGRKGWDNLTIILTVILTLIVFQEMPVVPAMIALTILGGMGFGYAAHKLRLLNKDGASLAAGLAISVILLGGVPWLVAGASFFIGSSLLSLWRKERKIKASAKAEKGSVRDARQVLSNGGVAWVLLLLNVVIPSPLLFWGFVGAFAAAAADTWATEIGTLSLRQPRLITTWKVVAAGTSGAITSLGSIAAILGSISVVCSTWLSTPGLSYHFLPLLMLSGVGAAYVDSLAGATIQGQYALKDGGLADMPDVETQAPVNGYATINNDVVNLICTSFGAFFGMACYLLVR